MKKIYESPEFDLKSVSFLNVLAVSIDENTKETGVIHDPTDDWLDDEGF